jgi:hypothetical protein
MKKMLSAIPTIVLWAMTASTANAAIVSIGTGVAVKGDRLTNLVTNGSFEKRAPGDPAITSPVYWSGVSGFHTDNTLQSLVYTIPGWGETSGRGAYGIWGDSSLLITDPCANGSACVYFGNWVTQPSPWPTFNGDGTVNFINPPTFTNSDPDNQTPTTLSQALNGLVMNETYLVDFWTSGEHYAAAFPDPGVFRLNIGASDSVFLTTPSLNSVFNANSIRYYVTFTADSTTETISFTNWGHLSSTGTTITATSTELILDDVIVNRVPEPTALALLATCLVGTCTLTRRRKTTPGQALPPIPPTAMYGRRVSRPESPVSNN